MLSDNVKILSQPRSGRYGYRAVHDWVRKHRGKPTVCEHCGSVKNIEWSNVSQDYLYDLNDWQQLCGSCHKKYDNSFVPTDLKLSSLTVVDTK